jgi:replicative DNA helicase Mcm
MTEHYKDGVYKEIWELDPLVDEIGESILIRAVIIGHGEIEHYPVEYDVKCKSCYVGYLVNTDGDWRKLKEPDRCRNCGSDDLIIKPKHNRLIRVLAQEVGKSDGQMLTIYVFGENILEVKPGKVTRFEGYLRSVKKRGEATMKRVFDVSRITCEDTKLQLPTDEELEMFQTLTKEKLIDSFAPNIKNMRLIKEGLILACIGGVKTDTTRGDINLFLAGDPGVAKTQLLEFVTKIVQKSDYASGKSSSQAGLMAGVDNLSDGTRVAKAGPVIMCSGGVVCIDEMDKMNAGDRSGLHEVMEKQTFSLKKIGINQTWPAETVIIGAANPIKSKWDPDLTIKDNIKLPDSLLSRFGLMFLIRDIPDEEEDRMIGEHILMNRMGKIGADIKPTLLMKFINHTRQIKPQLTQDAADELLSWWNKLRAVKQEDGAVQVDKRTLEDMARLSEAYARIRLSDVVEKEDALDAINMLKESLLTMGMNTPGERGASLVNHMNKDEFIKYIFGKQITQAQVVAEMRKKYKWFPTEDSALIYIEKLHGNGLIFESEGFWKWV